MRVGATFRIGVHFKHAIQNKCWLWYIQYCSEEKSVFKHLWYRQAGECINKQYISDSY